jgi:hypothetical protein
MYGWGSGMERSCLHRRWKTSFTCMQCGAEMCVEGIPGGPRAHSYLQRHQAVPKPKLELPCKNC